MEEENWQKKIVNFLYKNSNLVLIAILIFSIILRLKYLTINQAVWFDEGVYLSAAKAWALGTPFELNYIRPAFLPFFLAGVYKLGGGELTIRILMFLFSILGVLFTYLLGKELFDKRVALIATFITSFFYLNLFYTARILTGIPSTTLWLVSLWLFWKGYMKKESKIYLWLLGLLLVIGTLTRFPFGLIGVILLIYLLIVDRFKFLKEKNLWIGALIAIVSFIPYSIWYISSYERIPILGSASYYHAQNYLTTYLNLIPTVLQSPIPGLANIFPSLGHFFVLLLIIGLAKILFNLILGYDRLDKNLDLKKYLLVFLTIALPFFYFAFFAGQVPEDRYLFYVYPSMFYVIGIALVSIYTLIRKYSPVVGIAVIVIILAFTSFSQLDYADNLIKLRSNSYVQFKETGEFLKENSNPNEKIIATGEPQLTYYSERDIIYWPEEEDLDQFIEQNPDVKFLVLSILERSPAWTYDWPEKNQDKVTPAYAVFADPQQTQPVVIVYELTRTSNE